MLRAIQDSGRFQAFRDAGGAGAGQSLVALINFWSPLLQVRRRTATAGAFRPWWRTVRHHARCSSERASAQIPFGMDYIVHSGEWCTRQPCAAASDAMAGVCSPEKPWFDTRCINPVGNLCCWLAAWLSWFLVGRFVRLLRSI